MPKSKKRAMSARKATKKSSSHRDAMEKSLKALLKLRIAHPSSAKLKKASRDAKIFARAIVRMNSPLGDGVVLRSTRHGIHLG
jgi:hypothetical protein